MNITLSIDEKTVEAARSVAKSMGKSMNQMIRDYLQQMTKPAGDLEKEVEEFRRLSDSGQGHSVGWKFNREEFYDEVLKERVQSYKRTD
jgi:hypothetical protein